MLFLIYTEIPCKLLLLALKEYFEIIMNLYQILLVIYIYIYRESKKGSFGALLFVYKYWFCC